MTNYRDEDNPWSAKVEMGWAVNEKHDAWRSGFLAGEKSREFSEEEKGVINGLKLLACARAIHLEPAFYSLAKKVLGEE